MARAVIVVPCFNEAARLDARRFLSFVAQDRSTNFLFVNDGSRDCTLELLEGLHHANPFRFSFLHLARNRGKGEAIRQGMLLALDSAPAYVGYWDADLATPLDEIPEFCRVLDGRPEIQLVMGTRLPLLGRKIQRRPIRRLLGRLFARTASLVLGVPLYDSQCGAKLFRATDEIRSVFERPLLSRWIIDVEILARLKSLRRSGGESLVRALYELPLQRWRDVDGSKLRTRDFFVAIVELAEIYWAYLLPGRKYTAPSASRGLSSAPVASVHNGEGRRRTAA